MTELERLQEMQEELRGMADAANRRADALNWAMKQLDASLPEPEPEPEWNPEVLELGVEADYIVESNANSVLRAKQKEIRGGKQAALLNRRAHVPPGDRLQLENTKLSDFEAQGWFTENYRTVIARNLVIDGRSGGRDNLNYLNHLIYMTMSHPDLRGVNVVLEDSLLFGGWYGCKLDAQHPDVFNRITFRRCILADFVEAIGAKPNNLTPRPQKIIECPGTIFAFTSEWFATVMSRSHQELGYNKLVRAFEAEMVDLSEAYSIGTLRSVAEADSVAGNVGEVKLGKPKHNKAKPLTDAWSDRFAQTNPVNFAKLYDDLLEEAA